MRIDISIRTDIKRKVWELARRVVILKELNAKCCCGGVCSLVPEFVASAQTQV